MLIYALRLIIMLIKVKNDKVILFFKSSKLWSI